MCSLCYAISLFVSIVALCICLGREGGMSALEKAGARAEGTFPG